MQDTLPDIDFDLLLKIPHRLKYQYCSPVLSIGGKHQQVKKYVRMLPLHTTNFYEPFAGSMAFSLFLLNQGRVDKVFVSDIDKQYLNFFKVLKSDYNALTKEILNQFYIHKDDFDEMRNEALRIKCSPNDLSRAVAMYLLNKLEFCGSRNSRANSVRKKDVPITIDGVFRLPWFGMLLRDVEIFDQSYEILIQDASKKHDTFVFLDPPYEGKAKLYDLESFDLDLSACRCNQASPSVRVMITLNDSDYIRELFIGWNIYRTTYYNATSNKPSDELVITNYEITDEQNVIDQLEFTKVMSAGSSNV